MVLGDHGHMPIRSSESSENRQSPHRSEAEEHGPLNHGCAIVVQRAWTFSKCCRNSARNEHRSKKPSSYWNALRQDRNAGAVRRNGWRQSREKNRTRLINPEGNGLSLLRHGHGWRRRNASDGRRRKVPKKRKRDSRATKRSTKATVRVVGSASRLPVA